MQIMIFAFILIAAMHKMQLSQLLLHLVERCFKFTPCSYFGVGR
ncbi:Uncharacterised protein [Vibrio cholerae]|nr:Uncharacterised protein [Vibrio cholerae]CSD10328.1 Uncharacterised protein [Vibrio cholerae]CSD80472.1 Uncharacterised protein [Vibrio cholerae]CSI19986.1 Uncharacterised protein [Vibrio cholerae]CSI56826.1 Uncharacterised protein [Vibrio cholerae]